MNAGEARAVAERWLLEEMARSAGEVLCAFIGGSLNELAAGDPFPPSSDVDLIVGVPTFDPQRHLPRKRAYGGLFIEVGYVPRERLQSAEALLTDFALAPQLMAAAVLSDPDGLLAGVRATMAPEFARRHRVRQRCQALGRHARSLLEAFAASDSLAHLNAVALHAVRCLAQMALLADLRNPTVKRALVRSRDVFTAYGRPEENDALLRTVGLGSLGPEDSLAVAAHCRHALDQACRCLRTPFPGSNCLSNHAGAFFALDVPASVANGTGRETFVWVGSLYAYAMIALQNDAPTAVAAAATATYREDMARFGAGSVAAARARIPASLALLEHMTGVCDEIIERNARASA